MYLFFKDCFCAIAATKELSIPPDNITPMGTSLIILFEILSSKRLEIVFSSKLSLIILFLTGA